MLEEKLAQLRRKQGLSQQDVARALGVTRQTISNWECGQGAPAIDKAKELAALYSISLEDLVSDNVAIMAAPRVEESSASRVLQSLVGKTCRLYPASSEALINHMNEFGDNRKFKILSVNSEWLRVEYAISKGLFKSEPAVSLIDTELIGSIVVIDDSNGESNDNRRPDTTNETTSNTEFAAGDNK